MCSPFEAPREGRSSSWGTIQHAKRYTIGGDVIAVSVSTAGHGGFWVAPEHRGKLPAARRAAWYEEDSEWAIPYVALNLGATETDSHGSFAQQALETLRNWEPDAYEAMTGNKIEPGQSFVRDRAAYEAAHHNDWITGAAWGDWAHWVEPGHLGFVAQCAAQPGAERWFMISKESLATRQRGPTYGYVIEPSDREISAPEDPTLDRAEHAKRNRQ